MFELNNSNAQNIYQKEFACTNNDFSRGVSLVKLQNADRLIVGSTYQNSLEKKLLISLVDSNSNFIWAKSLNCDSCSYWEAEQIKAINDSSFVILSNLYIPTSGTYEYHSTALLGVNDNGDINWINYLKDPALMYEYQVSKIICAGNNCYGVGSVGLNANFTSNPDTSQFGLIINFDSVGNINWAKSYGRNSKVINDFSKTTNGFILVGNEETIDSTSINHNLIYFKIDSLGTIVWNYSINVEGTLNVIKPQGSNFLIGGSYFTSPGEDAFLISIDSLGSILWSKRYGNLGTGSDKLRLLIVQPDKLIISNGFHNLTVMDSSGNNSITHNVSNYITGSFYNIYSESDGGVSAIGATSSSGDIYSFKTDSNFYSCINYTINYPVNTLNFSSNIDSIETTIININNNFISSTESLVIFEDSILCETATTFEEINSNKYFEIYPNPCNSYIELHNLEESTENCSIQIFNSNGILNLKFNYQKNITRIDISKLNPGMYTIVINSNKYQSIKKFIKI